jgi:hypothetical protein
MGSTFIRSIKGKAQSLSAQIAYEKKMAAYEAKRKNILGGMLDEGDENSFAQSQEGRGSNR